jgi:hypothetical protein
MMLGNHPALGGITYTATTIAAVNGTPDSFTDSGNGFVTAGFTAGDTILVTGFLGNKVNNGIFTISSVATGKIEIVETSVVNEASGAQSISISTLRGGSLADIFKDGVLYIYTGSQPADADQATSGTNILIISVASGAWTAGVPANGLEFGTPASGVIAKNSQVWSGIGIGGGGTAGWFRLCANPTDAGVLSLVLPRIDGTVGTSGAQLNMSSTTIVVGATTTIDTFQLTFPAS